MSRCGDCKACCESLGFTHKEYELIYPPIREQRAEIDAAGIVFPFGSVCNKTCETGCSIYESRPQICREFECSFHKYENMDEKYRPSNCGFLTEEVDDTILFTPVDHTRTNLTVREYMSAYSGLLQELMAEISRVSGKKYTKYLLQRA